MMVTTTCNDDAEAEYKVVESSVTNSEENTTYDAGRSRDVMRQRGGGGSQPKTTSKSLQHRRQHSPNRNNYSQHDFDNISTDSSNFTESNSYNDNEDDDKDKSDHANINHGNKRNRKMELLCENVLVLTRTICGVHIKRKDIENHFVVQTLVQVYTATSLLVATATLSLKSSFCFHKLIKPIGSVVCADQTIGAAFATISQTISKVLWGQRSTTSLNYGISSSPRHHNHRYNALARHRYYEMLGGVFAKMMRYVLRIKIRTFIVILFLLQFVPFFYLKLHQNQNQWLNDRRRNSKGYSTVDKSLHQFKYGFHDTSDNTRRLVEYWNKNSNRRQYGYNIPNKYGSNTFLSLFFDTEPAGEHSLMSRNAFTRGTSTTSSTATKIGMVGVINPIDRLSIRMALIQLMEWKQKLKMIKRIDAHDGVSSSFIHDPNYGMPYIWFKTLSQQHNMTCAKAKNESRTSIPYVDSDPFPLSFDYTYYSRFFNDVQSTGTSSNTYSRNRMLLMMKKTNPIHTGLYTLYKRQRLVIDHLTTRFLKNVTSSNSSNVGKHSRDRTKQQEKQNRHSNRMQLLSQQSYWLFGRYLGYPVSTGQRMRKIINTDIIPYLEPIDSKILEIDPRNHPILEPFLTRDTSSSSSKNGASSIVLPSSTDRNNGINTNSTKIDLFAIKHPEARRRLSEIELEDDAAKEEEEELEEEEDDNIGEKNSNKKRSKKTGKDESLKNNHSKKRNPRIEYLDLGGAMDEVDVGIDSIYEDDYTCSAMVIQHLDNADNDVNDEDGNSNDRGSDDDDDNEKEEDDKPEEENGGTDSNKKMSRRMLCQYRQQQEEKANEKKNKNKQTGQKQHDHRNHESRKHRNIVPLDYIEHSGNITTIVEHHQKMRNAYSMIVSSNRIQQQIDFIDTLQKISTLLLMDGGYFVMEVPDKRYNGEYYVPETSLATVLEHYYDAYRSQYSSNSDSDKDSVDQRIWNRPKTLFEASLLAVQEYPDEIWDGSLSPKPSTAVADDNNERYVGTATTTQTGDVDVHTIASSSSLSDMIFNWDSTSVVHSNINKKNNIINNNHNRRTDAVRSEKEEYLERIRNTLIDYERMIELSSSSSNSNSYRHGKKWKDNLYYINSNLNHYHFTPHGMAYIIDSLYLLKYIDVYVHRLYETVKNEDSFTIVLKRCSQKLKKMKQPIP